MSLATACVISGLQASSIWKRLALILAFGLLLSFGAFPARAQDTLQTFVVATSWTQIGMCNPCPSNPKPVDSSSTFIIDTTTGQVSSSHITAAGTPLAFQSQQSGTGFTLLTFSGTTSDLTGDSIPIKLSMYLPVASLVGYSGGPLCGLNNSCSGGFATDTSETVNCISNPIQNTCFGSEIGTWTLTVGQLTPLSASTPDFSGSLSHGAASANVGGQATYDLAITPSGGFTSDVTLSVSGLPPGATGIWSPAVVTGGSGTSILTITTSTSTPPGIYNFTVTATSGTLSHSTTPELLVGSLDFTGTVTPIAQTVQAGNNAQYAISLSAVGTLPFGNNVTLSLSGVPSGVTSSFSTTTVNPDAHGTSVLTLSTSTSTPVGSYTLTLTGAGGGVSHSKTIQLVVTAAAPVTGDFSGSFNHASASVSPGGQVTYALTVTPSGGFTGNVVLSVSGLPAGATGSWSPAVVTNNGLGSSTLTITTSANTPPGTYDFAVSGVSGTLSHSATLTLLVGVVDFTGSITPGAHTVTAGGSAQYFITLSTVGTTPFGGNVTLAVSGLPTGVTAGFSNPTVNPDANGQSTLTLTTSASVAPGTYAITVSGAGQGAHHSTIVGLTVQ